MAHGIKGKSQSAADERDKTNGTRAIWTARYGCKPSWSKIDLRGWCLRAAAGSFGPGSPTGWGKRAAAVLDGGPCMQDSRLTRGGAGVKGAVATKAPVDRHAEYSAIKGDAERAAFRDKHWQALGLKR